MFRRIRLAVLLAFAASLTATNLVFAKGNFDFITVAGGGVAGELHIVDPALTKDWFAFADLPGGAIPAPASPPSGGYVITRYYIDHGHATPFDQLHYYPDAALVYYDGIQGGWSDYDRKWYPAKSAVKELFEREVSSLALQEALRRMPFLRRS
ncbi:MAG: hypothetical protein ACM3MF_03780 [Anaerolineae bacterium]